ncbi:MAG: hypothetical protein A4S17_09695 [Proteobacteria bacterium HN_bin10]|jgi:hypothetical protein|nr:MAG: hypothetical protein A4S17_09695 [Proteobacteria bacterium HN_bin10]
MPRVTRFEDTLSALRALPIERQDEVADIILTIIENVTATRSVLTDAQLDEMRRRQELGFHRADPNHFDKLIARLSVDGDDEARD